MGSGPIAALITSEEIPSTAIGMVRWLHNLLSIERWPGFLTGRLVYEPRMTASNSYMLVGKFLEIELQFLVSALGVLNEFIMTAYWPPAIMQAHHCEGISLSHDFTYVS